MDLEDIPVVTNWLTENKVVCAQCRTGGASLLVKGADAFDHPIRMKRSDDPENPGIHTVAGIRMFVAIYCDKCGFVMHFDPGKMGLKLELPK